MINIEGLDKAKLLMVLYNHAKLVKIGDYKPSGLFSFLDENKDMDLKKAKKLLSKQTRFDYLNDIIMKVDLTSDTEVDEYLYERDNGRGVVKKLIDELR